MTSSWHPTLTRAQRLGHEREFWDKERETRDPAERSALILHRLRHQLEYVYATMPFYRRHYDAHGFKPDQVRTLDDFTTRVPVITKKMLVADQAEHPPFGSYLGVARTDLARIHGSSGTMGTPTMYGVSWQDWQRAGQTAAMAFWTAGIRPQDLVQITFPFSLFFGGWGVIQACEVIGATTFPPGATVPTDKQIEFLFRLGTTALIGTPSYHVHLANRALELGFDVRESNVSLLICGGEPGGSVPGVRAKIKDLWGTDTVVVDASAGHSSEMYPFLPPIGCMHTEGGVHLYQDENYVELVERDDASVPVPVGTNGAVVATHLWRNSQPMIRFWLGDESVVDDSPCACGRTYPRLPRGVFGRVDDMLVIRGANIYPSAVEAAIRSVANAGTEFRIIVERPSALDEMRVEVEPRTDVGVDAFPRLEAELETALKHSLQIRVPVKIVEPGTHEAQTFKARRVIDNRNHG
jgi:phenylacetate-CoA ligase